MKLHKCTCGWSYVIGKRKVYGPIYDGATTIRIMSMDEFKRAYSDCVPR